MMHQKLLVQNFDGISEVQQLHYGHPICGTSIIKKKKHTIEHNIWWLVKSGNSNFWFDN